MACGGFKKFFPDGATVTFRAHAGSSPNLGGKRAPGTPRGRPHEASRRRAANDGRPEAESRRAGAVLAGGNAGGHGGTLADGDCGGEPHSLMGAARGGAVSASGAARGHGTPRSLAGPRRPRDATLAGGAARGGARWPGPRGGGARWPGLDTAGEGHQTAHLRHIREGRWRKMAVWCQQSNASPLPTWLFLGFLQSRVDIGGSIEAPNSLYATEMFCSMSQTGCLVLLSQLRAAWS